MIVQPDFPDHWKTSLLVAMTDHTAPLCLLRFWGHCQNRKAFRFDGITPKVLAAICKWNGDPDVWWVGMVSTFMEVHGSSIVAHEWEQVNSSLIAAWNRGQFGKLGGRPKKAKKTLRKPPRLSLKTLEKPDRLDRLDRKNTEKTPPSEGEASPHQQLIGGWMREFKVKFGESYKMQAKDGVAVKELLKIEKYTPDKILRIAKAAWDRPESFPFSSAVTIAGLSSRFNEIRTKLNGNHNGSRAPVPTGPTQDDTNRIEDCP